MYTVLVIVIMLVCLLLIGVVLIQESKGGGLSSGFSSGNQIMGVKRTGDVLEKATWGFAVALFVLCLLSAAMQGPSEITKEESAIKDYVQGVQPVQQAQPTEQAAPVEE